MPRPRRARWSWLALGLPAHVLFKALSPAFFARENTTTPLIASLKGLALALATAFLFWHLFGAEGIAAGIALGAWGSALGLIRERRHAVRFRHRCRGAPHGCRASSLAALVMAAASGLRSDSAASPGPAALCRRWRWPP